MSKVTKMQQAEVWRKWQNAIVASVRQEINQSKEDEHKVYHK